MSFGTAQAAAQVTRAEKNLNSFEARRTTYQTLIELSWDQVDVESVKTERDRWNRLIDEVRVGNPKIDQLQRQVNELKERVTGLTERIGQQKDNAKTLGASWESTVEEVDRAQGHSRPTTAGATSSAGSRPMTRSG